MRAITDRQLLALHFIAFYAAHQGYPPTIREIGAAMKISSLRGTTVHLDALQRKGFLVRAAGTARGIRITSKGYAEIATVRAVSAVEELNCG